MHRSIFVSSTFRDMHLERDAIHSQIIPAVNAAAGEWGDSVSACDLRWGIDTSDLEDADSSKKVLNVCLGEIDRCRPYMIVLLGYRYGWIPEEQLLEQTVEEKGFAVQDREISVTALEIEYGVLAKLENIDHTLFYFREIDGQVDPTYQAEDEIHRKKLQELKARILSVPGAHVQTYHVDFSQPEKSMRDFSRMVADDLYDLMKAEWEVNASLDRFAIDQKKQWEFLKEKSAQFLSREALLKECRTALIEEGSKILIHGETGSGKSTLVSRLGEDLAKDGFDIVPLFCGYTYQTSTGLDILQYLVYEIERRLGNVEHFSETKHRKEPTLAEWLSYSQELFHIYERSGQKDLIFLIDAADQLIRDEIAEKLAFLPEEDFKHIRFCLSMVTAKNMPFERQIQVKALNMEERRQVITGILNAKRRELSEEVIAKILCLPNADLPLYLNLIIQRMVMMDHEDFQQIAELGEGMEVITRYQLRLIDQCPETLDEMSTYIMDYSSRQIGGEPIRLMGYFLALSRHGLRMTDLEELIYALRDENGERTQLYTADAVAYLQYMGDTFLFRNDGRIDFSHKCFREGLLKKIEQAETLHHLIASWLHHLPASDEVRTQELGWHLILSGDGQWIAELVAEEEGNKPLLEALARDLAESVINDGGVWLKTTLYQTAEEYCFPSFSGYVGYHVFYQLSNTRKGLQLRLELAKTILVILEQQLKEKKSYTFQWDYTVCLERLASIERDYGTPEHMQSAKMYSEKCLTRRIVLLQYINGLDTYEKQMTFLLQNLEEQGRKLSGQPSPEQVREITRFSRKEALRGVCVAHEDIAQALEGSYPGSAQEALKHLKEALLIREQMYEDGERKGERFAAVASDEEYELAVLYQRIAKAEGSLQEDAAIAEAEKHLRQAVAISAIAQKKDPSELHIIGLSQSNRLLAGFFLDHYPEKIPAAIEIAKKCVAMLEPAYQESRSAEIQFELSLAYNLCGDLYMAIHEEETAHAYYGQMNTLIRGLKSKTENVLTAHAAVVAGIKETESAGKMSPEEMREHFPGIYLQARQLVESEGDEDACHRLDDVYVTLIHAIEESDFGRETIGKRAIIEVKCVRLETSLLREQASLGDRKKAIILFNEMSEEIQNLKLPDDAVWPPEWIELLEGVGISRDVLVTMPAVRAYQLSKKSLVLSREIVEQENTLGNRDILAVSLVKYAQICMQVDLQEFAFVNRELFQVASALYAETQNEKYTGMLFLVQMGDHLVEGTVSEFLDQVLPGSQGNGSKVKEEREQELLQKINALEKELSSLSGLGTIFRRKKIEKEVKELKETLRKLQSGE